ncbi:MAG: hypothetical protein ACOCV4_06015 [Myxococcota bacterium]
MKPQAPAPWVAPWPEDWLVPVPDSFAFAGVAFRLRRPGAEGPLRLPHGTGAPCSEAPGRPVAAEVELELRTDRTLPRERAACGFSAQRQEHGMRVDHARGHVDLRRRAPGRYEGVAALPTDTGGSAEMDALQAVAVAVLCAEGGAMVHAASVEVEGAAFLFVGPSDAGKTTACVLTGGRLLAIDRAALVPQGEGWVAWAVPGGPEDEVDLPRTAEPVLPLGAILRVVQATGEPEARLLPGVRATMVIRAALQWPFRGAREEERAMDAADAIRRRARVGEARTVLGRPLAPALNDLTSRP